MKTNKSARTPKADDMRAEYDFSGAVRGKFYKPLRKGYSVHIRQSNGATVVKQMTVKENTVVLEPDVQRYFPDSKSVNHALRCLIPLLPKKHRAKS